MDGGVLPANYEGFDNKLNEVRPKPGRLLEKCRIPPKALQASSAESRL
jgi:hypothetical protein